MTSSRQQKGNIQMNIKIDGRMARTTSPYNSKMMQALNRLEGTKRWGNNRTFSFESSPYNIEVWRSVFPNCEVEDGTQLDGPAVVEGGLFDIGVDRPTFKFKTQPRAHQTKALKKISELEACGLFMDVGTGKSWTAIAMMGKRWCDGKTDNILLIAKNGVHQQWVAEEIPKHMSEVVPYKAVVFGKTKAFCAEFATMLRFEGLKIFAINIDAIITKNGERFIMEFIKSAKNRCMMVLDESQDIKSLTAQRTKNAIMFGNLCKYKMIMTGTPIAKNVIDLFSQFKFLDPNILGHRYVTTYRNEYCHVRQTDFGPMITGYKNLEKLYEKIDPHIFRITSEEALDLPPKVYVTRQFHLSDQQKKLMKELKEQFFIQAQNKDFSSVSNAAGLLTKLQQISCGYLPMDDGSFMSLPNPRLIELQSILDQREGKAIIWCRFNRDIENVMESLKPTAVLGQPVAVHYYGKTTQAERERHKAAFLDANSTVRYLVASPEAAGTGLNLQGLCNTNIYYSNSFNSLARWQSEGRTWRDGTVGTVTYFDLIANKSPDAKILKNLQDKKSISDLTLDEYRKIFDFLLENE